MKKFSSILYPVAALLLLAGCKKDDGDPTTPDDNTIHVKYPATRSYYDGNNSAYPTVYQFNYNANKELTKYGKDEAWYKDIDQHGQLLVAYSSNDIFANGYGFSIANQLDTSVNIYSGAATQVRWVYSKKDRTSNVTTTFHSGIAYFINNADGYVVKEIQPDGGGLNVNYVYDDKKNLTDITWVALSGPRASAVYSRVKIVSVDDHPSPYFAIKGWRYISYPQVWNEEFAFAYCHNNPIQIITESYDATSNTWKVYEQDDFTYTYDEEGYPTHVVQAITYFTATTSHFTKTFDYTYTEL